MFGGSLFFVLVVVVVGVVVEDFVAHEKTRDSDTFDENLQRVVHRCGSQHRGRRCRRRNVFRKLLQMEFVRQDGAKGTNVASSALQLGWIFSAG